MTVEQTLKTLQQMARQRSTPDASRRMSWKLPEDLATEDAQCITLHGPECDVVDQLVAELAADLRFEHLEEPEEVVLRFVAEASLQRSANHVRSFVEQHARAIHKRSVVFTTHHLEIPERLEFAGVMLLPPGDELVPDVPELADVPDCGGYLMISCEGTNFGLMADRARKAAHRALALLRISMQMERMYHPMQLRFRLGDTYVIADEQVGWQRPEDIAYTAPLTHEVFGRVKSRLVTGVPVVDQKKGLMRQAQLAVDWISCGVGTG